MGVLNKIASFIGGGNATDVIKSLIPTIAETATSIYNTDQTNIANKKMAEYAYNKDLEMWNRANEYNTPEQQMMRIEKAGLNPNLVYGSGSVAGNQASTLPKYQAPRMEYGYKASLERIPAMIATYQDIRVKNAMEDKIREEVNLKKKQALTEGLRQVNLGASTDQMLWNITRGKGLYSSELAKSQQSANYERWRSVNEAIRSNLLQQDRQIKSQLYEKTRQDVIERQLLNEWLKRGVLPSDPLWMRWLFRRTNSTVIKNLNSDFSNWNKLNERDSKAYGNMNMFGR